MQKGLRKEDIESFGFEYRIGTFFSKDDKYTLSSCGNKPDTFWRLGIDRGHYGDSMVFEIKSKNELKTILKFVGYELGEIL